MSIVSSAIGASVSERLKAIFTLFDKENKRFLDKAQFPRMASIVMAVALCCTSESHQDPPEMTLKQEVAFG
jgi:hypothetical protein